MRDNERLKIIVGIDRYFKTPYVFLAVLKNYYSEALETPVRVQVAERGKFWATLIVEIIE
ncbi:MAG TPA: hypothetical protein DDZ51_14485 [Planctomycetaceae bacterium]|nr:hypothetical protein [Planctomycetaceae bacterium]